MRTDAYGKTWARLTDGTNGIPNNQPTRVAREDPDREGLLYAGTEFGMFVSFDDGDNWQSLQNNLPTTSVRDAIIKDNDLVITDCCPGFGSVAKYVATSIREAGFDVVPVGKRGALYELVPRDR